MKLELTPVQSHHLLDVLRRDSHHRPSPATINLINKLRSVRARYGIATRRPMRNHITLPEA